MRFDVLTLPDVPWPELVARWRHLDELGLDTIWVADNLVNPRRRDALWFEG